MPAQEHEHRFWEEQVWTREALERDREEQRYWEAHGEVIFEEFDVSEGQLVLVPAIMRWRLLITRLLGL